MQPGAVDRAQQSVEEAQVQAADEVRVRDREVVEGAVVQHHHAVVTAFGLEAERTELVEEARASAPGARPGVETRSHRGADARCFVARRPVDRRRDGRGAGPGAFSRLGEDPRRQLVGARRQVDADLGGRSSVHLGRSSGSGATTIVEPPVLGFEQPLVLQPVEMVGGHAPPQVQRRRCLLATDPRPLRDDVVVQRAAMGLGQRPDRVEIVPGLRHPPSVSTIKA